MKAFPTEKENFTRNKTFLKRNKLVCTNYVFVLNLSFFHVWLSYGLILSLYAFLCLKTHLFLYLCYRNYEIVK